MDNTVKLCCVDKGEPIDSLQDKTVDEIRNSDKFIKIRESFLKGEKLDRCKECWAHEKSGYNSYRQSSNKSYAKILPDNIYADAPLEIKYLDYRPSNLCNLACKICSPRFSSKLIQPQLELNFITKDQALDYTKFNSNRINVSSIYDNIKNVQNVYFAGGEPIISDDHWELLEYFSNNSPDNITIKYNTNLTKLNHRGKDVKDYWLKFKKIQIGASLDGYGSQFEHMRTGAKWEDILFNLDIIKKLSNEKKELIFHEWGYPKKDTGIEIYCDSTVGWLNLKSVFKLHKFLIEEKYVVLDDDSYVKLLAKPLNFPDGASLSATPPEIREELLDSISDYKNWMSSIYPFKNNIWESNINALIYLITNSNYKENNLTTWLKLVKHLDNKYNLDTPSAFVFENEYWNDKFYTLYHNIKLI